MDHRLRNRFFRRVSVAIFAFISIFCVSCSSLPVVLRPPASPDTPSHLDFTSLSYVRGVNVFSLYASRFQSIGSSDIGEPQSSYDFLASRGLAVIRLAVPWERIQPILGDSSGILTTDQLTESLSAQIDETYVDQVSQEVQKIQNAGMKAVIDLHAGCRYPSSQRNYPNNPVLRCGDGLTEHALERAWQALSSKFADDPGVIAYDLINEPNTDLIGGGLTAYRSITQTLVDEIRANGDPHVIWIESPVNSSAELANVGDAPWIDDPLHEITYSQHFYPGSTSSTNATYSPTVVIPILTDVERFAAWCEKWSVHCSIGEVGWPSYESQPQIPGSGEAWNTLGARIYGIADSAKMDVTYFAAQSSYTEWLVAYDNPINETEVARQWPLPGISEAHSQASVIEAHPSR